MLASILAALKAIPELVSLGSKLVDTAQALYEMYKEKKIDEWIESGRAVERKLIGAKTDAERTEILHELQRLRSGTPAP